MPIKSKVLLYQAMRRLFGHFVSKWTVLNRLVSAARSKDKHFGWRPQGEGTHPASSRIRYSSDTS